VIVGIAENGCLVISCVILVWGFKRLIKAVKSTDHLVNKTMIIWHIVAYFFIVIANILVFLVLKTSEQFEITTICGLVINLACTIILALIVNTICTSYLEKKVGTDASILQSLSMPEISFQSDVIRTGSNDYGAQSDLRSLPLI
jgi:hypothetical protein